jgi:hypothetical protein
MPSPFPGMNPYLEQPAIWPDFHHDMIGVIKELIAPQVAPNYAVRTEVQLYIHELPEDSRRLFGHGDTVLSQTPAHSHDRDSGLAATKLAVPARGSLPVVDFERVHFLEIRDRFDRQVVTVIELLSPSNKANRSDRDVYLAKRAQLLTTGVNFVEIDLLRGGPRMPVEGLPECDYYSMVCRSADRPSVDFWPFHLRDRMPTIPIPLRSADKNATLDLQACLHLVYDRSIYDIDIYLGEPDPALSIPDAEWARQFVPAPR